MAVPLEDILICPVTHERLQTIEGERLAQINRSIAQGELVFCDGRPVTRVIASGYGSARGEYAYAVEDGIIHLLTTDAIVLTPRAGAQNRKAELRKEKWEVQKFYDQVGWQKDKQGQYSDAVRFTDQRPIVKNYTSRCYSRIGKYLPARGGYFLDVASGPIPSAGSLALSHDFDFRICVDLSRRALEGAKTMLGEKGIYLLADITNLPIRDNAMDAVISLHTIYHVPADEQGRAFQELYRVLKPGSSAVVVYSWGDQVLPMKVLRAIKHILVKGPQTLFQEIWRKIRRLPPPDARPDPEPALYFYTHGRSWFNRSNLNFDFTILGYQSLNLKLLQTFIRPRLWGSQLLNLIFHLEGAFPRLSGQFGQYPMILMTK